VTPTDLAAMTGLELFRLEAERPAEIPSIRRLLGMRFDEIDDGRVVMSLKTRPDFANPEGTVHGGIAATLLDSVLGWAVHTTLPAGIGSTTLELKVNYIRAVDTDGQTLHRHRRRHPRRPPHRNSRGQGARRTRQAHRPCHHHLHRPSVSVEPSQFTRLRLRVVLLEGNQGLVRAIRSHNTASKATTETQPARNRYP
jgi:uncharacterized protein (TIGR00369 family)